MLPTDICRERKGDYIEREKRKDNSRSEKCNYGTERWRKCEEGIYKGGRKRKVRVSRMNKREGHVSVIILRSLNIGYCEGEVWIFFSNILSFFIAPIIN